MRIVPTPDPLFSVLVASYCNGPYLEAAVESVLRQSYANWELVIVDDASTDNSVDVLSQWRTDPRVRVMTHAVNQGAGAAFATAAAAASGELMGMLGADDALTANALEKMADAHARHPAASLINSDQTICGVNLAPLGIASPFGPRLSGSSLIYDCSVSNFATFKRSAYVRTRGFDPAFRRAVDHDLYLKLEEVGELEYVAEPLYLYRTHSGGISQGTNGILAAQYALVARANAYKRRRGTIVPNLTRREFREAMSTYHARQATLQVSASRLERLQHRIRSVLFRPLGVLASSFWLHTVRRFSLRRA
ncbi:MAG: glycosyltransferase [Gemmatimonadaceae bacterium]